MEYVEIFYRNKKISNLKDLLDKNKIINISIKDFLDTKSPITGSRNRDELFLSYSEQQKKELNLNSPSDISETTKIFPPVKLWVNINKVDLDIIKYESSFVKPKRTSSFISENISNIINSSGYYRDEFRKLYPDCTVWVWVKSLEQENNNKSSIDTNILNGRIINLSKFIQNINIGVTETGGNFSISLPFIPGTTIDFFNELDDFQRRQHKIDLDEIKFLKNGEILVDTTYFKYGERRNNFFNMIMQSNDLVFIKLEKLVAEPDEIIDDIFINNSALPNQYFDMIGLIDNVSQSSKPEDIDLNISGRDLMKLILDDGTFFFPNSYVSEDFQNDIFINSTGQSDAYNSENIISKKSNPQGRVVTTGLIESFFLPSARTIDSAISLLIKDLSNIEIIPSSVFDFYGEKRSTFVTTKNTNKKL